MFRRLIVEEEPEVSVVHLAVHDHRLEYGTLANHELHHAIDEAELGVDVINLFLLRQQRSSKISWYVSFIILVWVLKISH